MFFAPFPKELEVASGASLLLCAPKYIQGFSLSLSLDHKVRPIVSGAVLLPNPLKGI